MRAIDLGGRMYLVPVAAEETDPGICRNAAEAAGVIEYV
jgi:hypothetical protein